MERRRGSLGSPFGPFGGLGSPRLRYLSWKLAVIVVPSIIVTVALHAGSRFPWGLPVLDELVSGRVVAQARTAGRHDFDLVGRAGQRPARHCALRERLHDAGRGPLDALADTVLSDAPKGAESRGRGGGPCKAPACGSEILLGCSFPSLQMTPCCAGV
jgi:hypothetical protein